MRGIIADLFGNGPVLRVIPWPHMAEIGSTGTEAADATRIACAIVAGCDYLITTDDRMLKFVDHRIKVISLTDVIYLMEV